MPKKKPSKTFYLRELVSEFGAEVFSTDGSILFCKYCEVKVSAEKRFHVQQHIGREKHIKAASRAAEKRQSQLLLGQSGSEHSKSSPFCKDLCRALVSANIPLAKINNECFKKFLEQYMNRNIPDESTLRKEYVHRCYEDTIEKIRGYVADKSIFVSIDETNDEVGRSVANVMVGTLEEDKPGEIFLLAMDILEKVNHQTICQLFDKSLFLLWPQGIKHGNVLLFLTDAAPYMVKAGKAIKAFYPKLVHVTCLAHALHRVSEQVRKCFPDVDKLVSNVKKVFLKSPSRVRHFREIASDVPLPPEPVLTRWGTWLSACMYYCNHFEVIKSVINSLDREDAASIAISQDLIAKPELKGSLAYISSNFSRLVTSINYLEKRNETIHSVLSNVSDVQQLLEQCEGEIGKTVSQKMKLVLEKNQGYQIMCKISEILKGENCDVSVLEEEFSPRDLTSFKYAPLTSVDVERSFSMFRNVLSENRQSFTPKNLEMTIVIYCNAK